MKTEILKRSASYCYLGAPLLLLFITAVSASAQVIFADDFERTQLGPEWTSEPYAGWSIQDGKAYNTIDGTGGKLATTRSFDETNYAIETIAYPFEYGYWREYYLTFGQQNGEDSSYAIRYDGAFGGTLQIVKGTDNIYYPDILASRQITLNDTDPLKIRVEHFSDGTINLFISELDVAYPETPLLEANDLSYSTLGKIGWHISTQTAAQDFFMESIEATVLPSSPVIFADDFERTELGAFWEGSEGWTIQNGQAYNAPDDNGLPLTTAARFETTSYVLETKISNLVTGYYREYFLLFGQQGSALGDSSYVVNYDPDFGGVLSLGVVSDNYFYPDILDDQVVQIDPARSYKLKVAKYESGLIQVYLGDETGFPDVPTLEAIDTTYPTLGRVSWLCATQTAGEDFFVEYLRAEVPETQKTEPEKPAEDALIKQLFVNSSNGYEVGKLTAGATFFTDRPYTVTEVPSFLEGASLVKTANDDKKGKATDFLTVYLKQQAIAYVGYDPRSTQRPAWLSGWTKTNEVIGTTDPGSDYFEVYTKLVTATFFETYPYQLRLGANLAAPAAGANMNYIVAVVPVESSVRYEAEDATLSGAKEASNNAGYSGRGFADYINPRNDYVEWSVDITATSPYTLSFRYANGSSTPRSLLLLVDGQARDTVVFSTSRSWTSWAFRSADPLLISAGNHRIRLTALGSSGPNLDYVQLSPSATFLPQEALTSTARTASPPVSSLWPEGEEVSSVVNVYPNPTVDAITFRLDHPADASSLRIIDMQGREVYTQPLSGLKIQGTERAYRLDVSGWRTGTYLYQVRTGERVITGKVVKTN